MFDFLSRSFSSFFSKISGQKKLSSESMSGFLITIEEALLQADVPLDVARAFIGTIREDLDGVAVPRGCQPEDFVMKIIYDKLVGFLGGDQKPFVIPQQPQPGVVMVLGLQGSGKTTTLAKLGHLLLDDAMRRGKKVRILAASVDFYRPAAIDQLEVVAKGAGIDFYRAHNDNVLEAAREIRAYATANRYDTLLLDTAGRLHVDERMLEELRQVDGALNPAVKILVLDSMTGQESLNVAKAFDEKIGFTGAILTKVDSDARGGAAFSFRYALHKPIFFVAHGEKVGDLQRFVPERIASRMIGMGDLEGLLERVDCLVKQNEQEQLTRARSKGKFTLDDFAQQMDVMSRLGSLGNIMKYLPGAAQFNVSAEQLEEGERTMRRFRAILSSMTTKERLMPEILNGSRKKRIACGSGVAVEDVNELIQRFAETQKMMQNLGKFSGRSGGGLFGRK